METLSKPSFSPNKTATLPGTITGYPGLTYFQDVHFHIQPTKLSRRRKFKVNNLPRNRNNLIQIPLNRKPNNESKTKLAYVPSFLLSNVMSPVPKIDEVVEVIQCTHYDFICFVETWLQPHIHDNVVTLGGYNTVRRDRINKLHGGVCIYIKDSIRYTAINELADTSFEALWVHLHLRRLPRGFSNLVVGVVYHPPRSENAAMLDYLSNCLSYIESHFPTSGLIFLGDFNKLNITRLCSSYNLKQIVKFATRGNTLDLILTNLSSFYASPIRISPFGLSDHMSIEVKAKDRSQLPAVSKVKVKTRDLRPSARLAIRRYLELVDVPSLINQMPSCDGKVSLLESIVKIGLDFICPFRLKTVHSNNPPWLTAKLSNLIKNRQTALRVGNMMEFKRLRNQVNRERKSCRSKFYLASLHHLRQCNPSTWWSEVKKLSGMKPGSATNTEIIKSLKSNASPADTSTKGLANDINKAFLSPMRHFVPLPSNFFHSIARNIETPITVTRDSIYLKLSKLNPKKAQGPDGIPSWLLKENADLLAGSITDIINCSYREGCLPTSWKKADVVAIPKQKPVKDINNHLRPISLTPIISKLAEEIVVNNYVRPAVMEKIDDKQFGTIPNSSTTHALISMLHTWTLFIIMINDLTVSGVDALWKYVDDTTLSESLAKNDPSLLQHYVDDFVTKSQSDGNTKSWFKNNLGRLLVDRLTINVEGKNVYENTGESLMEVYKDLWRSEEDRDNRQDFGIAKENVRKLVSKDDSANKAAKTDGVLDVTIANMCDRIKIPLGKILCDHGPYAPYGMSDFEYRITLPKSDKIMVAQTNEATGTYGLTDMHLEYEIIESESLAERVRGDYNAGRSLGYDYTTKLKTLPWDKDSTRQVIDINIPRKSMTLLSKVPRTPSIAQALQNEICIEKPLGFSVRRRAINISDQNACLEGNTTRTNSRASSISEPSTTIR